MDQNGNTFRKILSAGKFHCNPQEVAAMVRNEKQNEKIACLDTFRLSIINLFLKETIIQEQLSEFRPEDIWLPIFPKVVHYSQI